MTSTNMADLDLGGNECSKRILNIVKNNQYSIAQRYKRVQKIYASLRLRV